VNPHKYLRTTYEQVAALYGNTLPAPGQ